MRKLAMGMLIGAMMLVGAAACSTAPSATSGAPPAANVTGRWTGTYVFEPSSAGNGNLIVEMTQSGSAVKGTLDIQGPHRTRAYVLNGTMSGNDIQIIGPDITGWMKVSGNEMTGLINGVLPTRVTLRKAS
jgi:hypothetical protein